MTDFPRAETARPMPVVGRRLPRWASAGMLALAWVNVALCFVWTAVALLGAVLGEWEDAANISEGAVRWLLLAGLAAFLHSEMRRDIERKGR